MIRIYIYFFVYAYMYIYKLTPKCVCRMQRRAQLFRKQLDSYRKCLHLLWHQMNSCRIQNKFPVFFHWQGEFGGDGGGDDDGDGGGGVGHRLC